jgi:hypothetical protein
MCLRVEEVVDHPEAGEPRSSAEEEVLESLEEVVGGRRHS